MMVVMALVTTVMTEPLLRRVYPEPDGGPRHRRAERAELGAADAFKVLVAVPKASTPGPAAGGGPGSRGVGGPGAAGEDGAGPAAADAAGAPGDGQRAGLGPVDDRARGRGASRLAAGVRGRAAQPGRRAVLGEPGERRRGARARRAGRCRRGAGAAGGPGRSTTCPTSAGPRSWCCGPRPAAPASAAAHVLLDGTGAVSGGRARLAGRLALHLGAPIAVGVTDDADRRSGRRRPPRCRRCASGVTATS